MGDVAVVGVRNRVEDPFLQRRIGNTEITYKLAAILSIAVLFSLAIGASLFLFFTDSFNFSLFSEENSSNETTSSNVTTPIIQNQSSIDNKSFSVSGSSCNNFSGIWEIQISIKNEGDENLQETDFLIAQIDDVNVLTLLDFNILPRQISPIISYSCPSNSQNGCGPGSHNVILTTPSISLNKVIMCNYNDNEQTCEDNQTRSCNINTLNGTCSTGEQTCTSEEWGNCTQINLPTTEDCNNGLDDDCDGRTDECSDEFENSGELLWMHPNGGITLLEETDLRDWDTTFTNIDGVGVLVNELNSYPPLDLAEFFQLIIENNKMVQVETERISSASCTGVAGATIDLREVSKLADAGVYPLIIQIKNPYTFTSNSAPSSNNCMNDNDAVATEIVEYMKTVNLAYPKIEFMWGESIKYFEIENYESSDPDTTVGDLSILLPLVFEKAEQEGISLAGFTAHYSLESLANHHSGDGWNQLLKLRELTNNLGKRFSVVFSYENSNSNERFHDATLGYYDCFLESGGELEDTYVESSESYPTENSPEETQYTFTNTMTEFIDRIENPSYGPSCDFINNEL